MLRALKRLFGGATQLDLGLDRAARPEPSGDQRADVLFARLRAFGLSRIQRCRLTRNRHVMVSFSGGALRVHEGYLGAPPEVLCAIVVFVEGRTRAERRAAQRLIVSHPIGTTTASTRRPRTPSSPRTRSPPGPPVLGVPARGPRIVRWSRSSRNGTRATTPTTFTAD